MLRRVGRRGILLAGPNVVQHELVIKHLLMLCSLDMFVQVFFQRCFTLADTLNKLREDINQHTKDPASVPRIRRKLSQTSVHIIMLGEILGYLDESVVEMDNPQYPKDVKGIELYHKMEIPERLANLKERVRDLSKNVRGCKHEQENLSQMTDVINTTKLCDTFALALHGQLAWCLEVASANSPSHCVLLIMQRGGVRACRGEHKRSGGQSQCARARFDNTACDSVHAGRDSCVRRRRSHHSA